MMQAAKLLVKMRMARLLFRYYPITLDPLRLHRWVSEAIAHKNIEGDYVEIGVNLGGTSLFTKKVLNDLRVEKQYYCFDTFSGFVREQVNEDLKRGMRRHYTSQFGANSEALVRKIFAIHGVSEIITVKGDIKTQENFPDRICACLLDVDLSEPTYWALTKVYPRLSEGGIIVVDDCYDAVAMKAGSWRAREGVERFAAEHNLSNLSIIYKDGLGIINK